MAHDLTAEQKITKQPTMPRPKKIMVLSEPVRDQSKTIRVRIDHRTVITVGSQGALANWLKRYPSAVVIG